MNIPSWLIFLVAFWVIAFGAFRIYIARQKKREQSEPQDPDKPNFRNRGLYAQSAKRHTFFGFAYIALGGVLILMGFGVKLPIHGGCQGDTSPAEPTTMPSGGSGVDTN